MSGIEARELVDQVLEEQALAVAGMAAVRDLSDEQVQRLVDSLDAIRGRMMVQIAVENCEAGLEKSHPAVEGFLAKLRAA